MEKNETQCELRELNQIAGFCSQTIELLYYLFSFLNTGGIESNGEVVASRG